MSDPPHHGSLLARSVVLPDGGARFVVPDVPHDPDPSAVPAEGRDAARVFPEGAEGRVRDGRFVLRTRVAAAVAGRQRLWLQAASGDFAAPEAQVVFPRWVPQPARDFRVRVALGDALDGDRYRFRFAYDGAVSAPVAVDRREGRGGAGDPAATATDAADAGPADPVAVSDGGSDATGPGGDADQ